MGAQSIGGQAVEASTQRPLRQLLVRLVRVVDSTVMVVDSVNTSESGMFELLAPSPGVYRVQFGMRVPRISEGPLDTLRSDTEITRRFGVPVRAWEAERPFLAGEVSIDARLAPEWRPPRYPLSLALAGKTGVVLLLFALDSTGRPETKSLRVLYSSHGLFESAVRSAWPFGFVGASFGGIPVRQTVCNASFFGTREKAAPLIPLSAIPAGYRYACITANKLQAEIDNDR
jgi:hypothetical protein